MTENVLLTLGAVAIVAAIIGGGLKAFGVEIGAVGSVKRQVLLFVVGTVFLGLAFWSQRETSPEQPDSTQQDLAAQQGTVEEPIEQEEEEPIQTGPEDAAPAHFEGEFGIKGWVDNRPFFDFLEENAGSVVRITARANNNWWFPLGSLDEDELCFARNTAPTDPETGNRMLYNRAIAMPLTPPEGVIPDLSPEQVAAITCPHFVTFRGDAPGPVWSHYGTGQSSWQVNGYFYLERQLAGPNINYYLTERDGYP